MDIIASRIAGAFVILSAAVTSAMLPVAHAGDGTIIIQRTVQPRVATRATLVPDPHPISVNPNVSAQVTRQVGNAELNDSEYANVTSGASLRQRILPDGSLGGLDRGANQSLQGSALGSGNGGSGGAIANSVNRTLQQGLAPLHMLSGER